MKVLDDALGEYLQSEVIPLPSQPDIVAAAGSPIGAEVANWKGINNTVRVKISDRSMVPIFHDGDVISMHHRSGTRSEYMKKGLIYLVEYDGGYTVKRYNTREATAAEIEAGISYTSTSDGKPKQKVPMLESLNPEFPEIVIKDAANWIAWLDPKKDLKP